MDASEITNRLTKSQMFVIQDLIRRIEDYHETKGIYPNLSPTEIIDIGRQFITFDHQQTEEMFRRDVYNVLD